MNAKELYQKFAEVIPEHLREPWDNDGIMCCADGSSEVYRVLVSLDVTEEIVDYAIERGFDVCYTTAISMMEDFETEHFNSSRIARGELTDKYFDSDLLIIDDLGTEMVNQFTISALYNLLNVRINRHLPMILSTNLSGKDLMTKYNDRINSRLFGEFRPVRFLGSDVRMKKFMG